MAITIPAPPAADLAYLDPTRAAWVRARHEALPSVKTRRAALVYAAGCCAEDPAWLNPTHESLVRDLVHTTMSQTRFWPAFDRLVAATLAGFGPMMAAAVDVLVVGERS